MGAPGSSGVKNVPASAGDARVLSLGWEGPLEKNMASHSSTLAWRIPRTEEPGRLKSMLSQRVGHNWVTEHMCTHTYERLFVTPWTVAYQAPPSVGFSRQEYWIGLPFPSPGDLPHPGIELWSPTLQADALPSEPPGKTPHRSEVK